MGTDNVFTITPVKAKYGAKKDYLTVVKQGYILFEMIPISASGGETNIDGIPKQLYNWQQKDNFVMSPERSTELLPIDVSSKEDFSMNFRTNKDGLQKNLVIESDLASKIIKLRFDYQSETGNISMSNSMTVSQFLIFQKMVDYSLPYMMGWHILGSNKIAQEDFLNEPRE